MKRILCIILAFALLVPFHALTESTNRTKKISFRGVEWGASVKDVKSSFIDPMRWGTMQYNSCFNTDYWTTGKGKVYSGDICGTIESDILMNKKLKVAGRNVSEVVIRFAVMPGDSEPAFIMGEYLFASGDLFNTFFDLRSKLSDLYGNEQEMNTKMSSVLDYYYVWKDDDGNTISLLKHGDSIVSLRYISGKMDSLLSAASLASEQQKNASYDGL